MLLDDRINQLAEKVLKYSLNLKKGERIYIEAFGNSTHDMLRALIQTSAKIGAVPFYYFNDDSYTCAFLSQAGEAQIKALGDIHQNLMAQCDAYVAVRGKDDVFALSDISDKKLALYRKHYLQPVHSQTRVPQTRWCVLRYPNTAMAALSRMSLKQFEDFYFDACLVDYKKMEKELTPLKKLMDKTDKVRIIAPGTDVSFSIKNIGSVICCGHRNIPDGEVYTAPVKNSVNGVVQFNTDTTYNGTFFSNIRLVFQNGKIIEGSSLVNNDKFQKILNQDEGARYLGEFSFGTNPFIQKPILDILFDEKINGSFHMAIGNAYDETDNGNRSAIHWDLVQIQTPQNGGGEIWFDGKLVRKDGKILL